MQKSPESSLGGRDRTRLQRARENGYLDARCRLGPELIRRHGGWCWRMKVPLVWFERRSPYSRFGRVHLEMFTTANILSQRGQSSISAIRTAAGRARRVTVSPHDACWESIPLADLSALARSVFRAATRPENYDTKRPGQTASSRRPAGNLIEIRTSRVA